MKSKILVIALICFGVMTFSGCALLSRKEGSQTKTPGLLEPALSSKFNDLPVPAGFKFLPRDSYSFESAGVRVAVLRYQGKVDSDQVVNFYKEQMPIYNWNLLNVIEYGQRLMNFDRQDETCIISLLPKGNATIITISLGPKSQILPKKGKETIK
ncbi:MAG: hypothetical protein NT066_04520 [Candidatus Omnitrophica bacterium]|nr:hypothetical protein [Candidatus Omnitrophota bacterium]